MTDMTVLDAAFTAGAAPLTVTPSAQAKLAELLAGAGDEVCAVRVFVAGGGCGGLSYGMTFAEAFSEHDYVIEAPGLKVAIDAVAANYLRGAEIDFTIDSLQPTFVFRNAFQSGGGGGCGGGGGGGGGCGSGGCGR